MDLKLSDLKTLLLLLLCVPGWLSFKCRLWARGARKQ